MTHGRTGFLVRDHEAMAAAVNRLEEIDPATCRADVQARFDAATVARQYVRVYREAINPGAKVGEIPWTANAAAR